MLERLWEEIMELFAAAVLGVIQGLTEFLPISSSAHLILVPWLLGWTPEGISFDVSLHVGTALAILAYFWRDWWLLAGEVLRGLATGRPFANRERRLAWFILVGTLPAAVTGLLFEKQVEETLRSPLITVFTLAGLGILLYIADRWGRKQRTLDDFSWGDSIWIGLSQALALVPGVSRSGITMSTAMLRGADRPSAARFSFLLATPVIVGAGIFEGWHLMKALRAPALGAAGNLGGAAPVQWPVLAVGVFCAAGTGFLCIRYFLRYLQRGSFLPFVIYRFILAAVVLWFCYRAS
jgi:undecaprenyl-diphosphatase